MENKTLEDIIRLAEEKRAERGGFDNKVYLEKVIELEVYEAAMLDQSLI